MPLVVSSSYSLSPKEREYVYFPKFHTICLSAKLDVSELSEKTNKEVDVDAIYNKKHNNINAVLDNTDL